MEKLVIDCETTGFSPEHNDMLTCGLLYADITPTKIKILDTDHILIKHERYNVSAGALQVNKIDISQHNTLAESPKKSALKINSFVKKHKIQDLPLLGHNLNFDLRFLNALSRKSETEIPLHHEYDDTMKIWMKLRHEQRVPWIKASLGTLAEHFDIDRSDAHTALGDCHITSKVYQKLLKII